MNITTFSVLRRCLLVWVGATTSAAGLVSWLLPSVDAGRRALSGPAGLSALAAEPFEQVLTWLCALAALVGAGWLWVVVTVVAVEAARGAGGVSAAGRARAAVRIDGHGVPGVPAGVRRLVLAACGIALVTGAAAPALATPGPVHLDRSGQVGASLLAGLPLPDRPTGAGALEERFAAAPSGAGMGAGAGSRAVDGAVDRVVRPGDTLWSIAAAQLPPGADDADVTAQWHRLHALNRGVVGGDPDLIHPGQQLRLPPPSPA